MNAWSEKMEPSIMLFGGGGQLFRTESNYQFFFLQTLIARKLIHYIYPYRKLTRLPFVEATAGKRYELGTNQQAVGWRLGRVRFAHWRIENRVNKTKGKRSCRKTERWLWTGLYWKATHKKSLWISTKQFLSCHALLLSYTCPRSASSLSNGVIEGTLTHTSFLRRDMW